MSEHLEFLTELQSLLEGLEFPCRIEQKEGAEHLVINARTLRFLLQIRLTKRGDNELYGIVKTPIKIPEGSLTSTYVILNEINMHLAIGVFFIVAEKREIFLKTCIPVKKDGLDLETVEYLITHLVTTVDTKMAEFITGFLLSKEFAGTRKLPCAPCSKTGEGGDRPKGVTLH